MSDILLLVTHKVTVFFAVVLALLLLTRLENDLHSALYSMCGIALLAALILAISRRIAFSVYAALAIAVVLALPSMVKARMTGMSLHSFDLALIADPQMLGFFLSAFGQYAVPVLAIAVVMIGALILVYRHEQPTRMRLWQIAVPSVALAVTAPLAMPRWADETSYLFQGRHISALLVSLRDLPQLWAEHPLNARVLRAADTPPYESAFVCDAQAPRPDIILVHAESQLPPEWMGMKPIAELADSFRSQDGLVHRLRAETYGGGSWITTASVMTGLPAGDYGWMRQFISSSVVGNVQASVPQILSDCGYETTAQLAMTYDEFALGPMLASLGFQEVNDSRVTGISELTARDSSYLDAILKRLREKRAMSRKPQLVYVETMFAHSPYDQTLAPTEVLEGAPYSADPIENEYLRRLVIARRDLGEFKAKLAADPGPNGAIVLEYGDHRPMVQLREGNLALGDFASTAYVVYYAANAFGVDSRLMFPDYPLDAPYIGYWLIEVIGIANGGIVEDMRQVRERCAGKLHLCQEANVVDEFLRRRVDSGLLRLRPLADAGSS